MRSHLPHLFAATALPCLTQSFQLSIAHNKEEVSMGNTHYIETHADASRSDAAFEPQHPKVCSNGLPPIMRTYCTYFDSNYLVKALALIASLERFSRPYRIFALCLDDEAYETIRQADNTSIIPVRLGELEAQDPELFAEQHTRSRDEYYITCTPCWISYVFRRFPDVNELVYVDADLFFYSRPDPVLDLLTGNSVLVIENRFPNGMKHMEAKAGRFNVGLIGFRRTESALKCLGRWREQCLEWCHNRYEDGRFGDQRYLDEWPEAFEGVVVCHHPGANLAPWNLARHSIARVNRSVTADGEPLIFFHFSGFRVASQWLFSTGLVHHGTSGGPDIIRGVYLPYAREILAVAPKAKNLGGCARIGYGADAGTWRAFRYAAMFGPVFLLFGPFTLTLRTKTVVRWLYSVKKAFRRIA
jgi:hypothetical protein